MSVLQLKIDDVTRWYWFTPVQYTVKLLPWCQINTRHQHFASLATRILC